MTHTPKPDALVGKPAINVAEYVTNLSLGYEPVGPPAGNTQVRAAIRAHRFDIPGGLVIGRYPDTFNEPMDQSPVRMGYSELRQCVVKGGVLLQFVVHRSERYGTGQNETDQSAN
jgi:hypothetical protein